MEKEKKKTRTKEYYVRLLNLFLDYQEKNKVVYMVPFKELVRQVDKEFGLKSPKSKSYPYEAKYVLQKIAGDNWKTMKLDKTKTVFGNKNPKDHSRKSLDIKGFYIENPEMVKKSIMEESVSTKPEPKKEEVVTPVIEDEKIDSWDKFLVSKAKELGEVSQESLDLVRGQYGKTAPLEKTVKAVIKILENSDSKDWTKLSDVRKGVGVKYLSTKNIVEYVRSFTRKFEIKFGFESKLPTSRAAGTIIRFTNKDEALEKMKSLLSVYDDGKHTIAKVGEEVNHPLMEKKSVTASHTKTVELGRTQKFILRSAAMALMTSDSNIISVNYLKDMILNQTFFELDDKDAIDCHYIMVIVKMFGKELSVNNVEKTISSFHTCGGQNLLNRIPNNEYLIARIYLSDNDEYSKNYVEKNMGGKLLWKHNGSFVYRVKLDHNLHNIYKFCELQKSLSDTGYIDIEDNKIITLINHEMDILDSRVYNYLKITPDMRADSIYWKAEEEL